MNSTILKPKYRVELLPNKGNKHVYRAWLNENYSDPSDDPRDYNSVTYFTSIIEKPGLYRWNRNVAIEHVREVLDSMWEDGEIKIDDPVVLKDILDIAKKMPDKIKDDAAFFGTQFHALVDRLWNGENLIHSTYGKYGDSLLNFLEWQRKSKTERVFGDTKVASHRNQYGGSFDALAIRDGCYGVLDWKTSNSMHEDYDFQVAAYASAVEEMYDIEINWCEIIRVDKEERKADSPGFEIRQVKNWRQAFKGFLACKELKEQVKERSKCSTRK